MVNVMQMDVVAILVIVKMVIPELTVKFLTHVPTLFARMEELQQRPEVHVLVRVHVDIQAQFVKPSLVHARIIHA